MEESSSREQAKVAAIRGCVFVVLIFFVIVVGFFGGQYYANRQAIVRNKATIEENYPSESRADNYERNWDEPDESSQESTIYEYSVE